ncbi:aminotransferase class I/II-fold pyridoxal phosphate-dependent enzyme [Algoriphagus halophytocola]|uniref:aminotransferase class I/II-fold pyridoxal phosphate-dependent enzyme n=1 Tax=Algoriphagus halophytocola TaxID=2991499 RepID=UPI0022DDAC56|nr:aminotransferase class I/II-fold pyridoxal phosphate-dependent enzyme [Algoriphagus sp. TR-M9]WBL41228.1 aminotransferase class I/II-fold pyridoxal phosphate-dependent enzyme [Algoriphagus sp. TR-M9]
MYKQIPLSFPSFNGNESLYTRQAIDSGHLATYGAFIGKFEWKLNTKLRTHESVVLNSGTSALHLAMVLMGIGPEDEVICQSFTFCASANPIVYLGAKPVFVDSESDTWNISPELLEDAILNRISNGKKPKAIVVVHLFGMPAKMNEILEISRKYNIPVLEDAAEAVGSVYEGEMCGTFGQIGVYSFNGNKIITTGGGGALISDDTNILQKARHLSTQAREDLPYYQHLEIGYNYKMNNLAAAVGLAQLEKLENQVKSRRAVNARYRELFKDIPGISFHTEPDSSQSNYWLTAILINSEILGFDAACLQKSLSRHGIESRYLWKPLHMQPVFADAQFYGGKTAQNLFENGLCLPSSADLKLEDQERILAVIKKELAKSFK